MQKMQAGGSVAPIIFLYKIYEKPKINQMCNTKQMLTAVLIK